MATETTTDDGTTVPAALPEDDVRDSIRAERAALEEDMRASGYTRDDVADWVARG